MLFEVSSTSLDLRSTIPEFLAIFELEDFIYISLSQTLFFSSSLIVFKLFLPFYPVSRELEFADVRISEQMGEQY